MPRRNLYGFIVILLAFLSLTAAPLKAQSAADQHISAPAPAAYDSANEVVLRGTISQVTTQPAPGLPLGLHLILSTAQGAVDAHLGPFLSSLAAQKGLVSGASVQMVGVKAHLAAGDLFLVRTVIVGGQTIVVRNANGFPVRQVAPQPRVVRGTEQKDGL